MYNIAQFFFVFGYNEPISYKEKIMTQVDIKAEVQSPNFVAALPKWALVTLMLAVVVIIIGGGAFTTWVFSQSTAQKVKEINDLKFLLLPQVTAVVPVVPGVTAAEVKALLEGVEAKALAQSRKDLLDAQAKKP